MNQSNPFVPQGSLLEQQSKRRSHLKMAVFGVLTLSVTSLAVMLIQGCKRELPPEATDMTAPTLDTNAPALIDTNAPAFVDTNPPVVVPPMAVVPPVDPVPQAPAGVEYVVAKGDTLAIIARKNHLTVKSLEAANPGVVPTKLRIGQKLVLPAGSSAAPAAAANSTGAGVSSYVVKSGDTLMRIAKTHGTTVKAIQSENNLATTKINVGQKLKIPVKAAAVAPAPLVEPAPAIAAPVMPESMPVVEPAK